MKYTKLFSRCICSGYLRIIGVALFVWIVIGIDKQQLATIIVEAHIPLLVLSLFLHFLVYIAKMLRWHTMVLATAIRPTLRDSWCLYNIGVFLATITPAKLGELGKAAYLKKAGLPAKLGIAIVIIDRLADVLVIALLGIGGAGILLGPRWLLFFIAMLGILSLVGLFAWRRMPHTHKTLIVAFLPKRKTVLLILLYTIVSWILYFIWAIALAKSIAITAPILPFISVLTVTGILSLLPIAPAGLGTRDAALIALLAVYGITSSQAVALAMLMFCSILIMGIPGGLCWITQKK